MLQCKAASLVNIAHSRKFHEPTFQQLGVRVRKIKQNASYSWMGNVLTAANAPRNDATLTLDGPSADSAEAQDSF